METSCAGCRPLLPSGSWNLRSKREPARPPDAPCHGQGIHRHPAVGDHGHLVRMMIADLIRRAGADARWAPQHMLAHTNRATQQAYRSDFDESQAVKDLDEFYARMNEQSHQWFGSFKSAASPGEERRNPASFRFHCDDPLPDRAGGQPCPTSFRSVLLDRQLELAPHGSRPAFAGDLAFTRRCGMRKAAWNTAVEQP